MTAIGLGDEQRKLRKGTQEVKCIIPGLLVAGMVGDGRVVVGEL